MNSGLTRRGVKVSERIRDTGYFIFLRHRQTVGKFNQVMYCIATR